MKIVIIAAHTVGRYAVERIAASGHEISAMVTLDEDARLTKAGFHPFRKEAIERGIPWYAVKDINSDDSIALLKSLSPDMIFVLGWSQLLRDPVLGIAPKGVVGAHTSLLPKNRGRSPLNWALINGDAAAGISLFYFASGADTGLVISQRPFSIEERDDIRTLYDKAELALGEMVESFLAVTPLPKGMKQDDDDSTYLPKRRPSDGLLSFAATANACMNLIRALREPYPCAYFYHDKSKVYVLDASIGEGRGHPGTILKIEDGRVLVAAGEGAIWLSRLQKEGLPPMWASDFAERLGLIVGQRLNKPSDHEHFVEYRLIDGEGGTAYRTNVAVGEEMAFGIHLFNHSQKESAITLRLLLDGEERETRSLVLLPDSGADPSFSFSISASGEHKVEIVGVIDRSIRRDYLFVRVR